MAGEGSLMASSLAQADTQNKAKMRQLLRGTLAGWFNTSVVFYLTNTTEVLSLSHEPEANEEVVGTAGGDLPARQGFASEGVFERAADRPADARHGTAELGKGLEAAIKRQLGLK